MNQIELCVVDESEYFSIGWSQGPPRGIIFHLSDTENFIDYRDKADENTSSAHFYISRDPDTNATVQTVDIDNRSWHAYDASHYYFGIVHECVSNTSELTLTQLKESARISAALIKFSKERWGVSIPIIRAPGGGFSPGFKDHKDGLGSEWNKNLHTDGLIMTWTWEQYLNEVKKHLEEDDMALFEDKADFRLEVRKALSGTDSDGNPNLSTEEIASSLQFILGMNARAAGSSRPNESGPKQRGWDTSEAIMRMESAAGGLPNKGKISGIVTFE